MLAITDLEVIFTAAQVRFISFFDDWSQEPTESSYS